MEKLFRLLLSSFLLSTFSFSLRAQNIDCSDTAWRNRATQGLFQQYYLSRQWQHTCDSILTLCPGYDYIWQMKAMPSFKSGIYDFKSLDKAVAIDAGRRLPYRAFMKCIFAKDYLGAIKDLKSAESLIKNGGIMDHTFSFYLGLCYLGIEQPDSAVFYFQKDIAHQRLSTGIGNEHYNSLFYLGLSFLQVKNYKNAEEYLKASLKAYSKFPEPNFYLAKLLKMKKKKDDAIFYFNSAKKYLAAGSNMNEDNSIYVDYPFQIGLSDIENELVKH